MRSTTPGLLALLCGALLLTTSASAAEFRAVHAVDGATYVELDEAPAAVATLRARAGVARRLRGFPVARVRAIPAEQASERPVRLVGRAGVCDGTLGPRVLLELNYPDYQNGREIGAGRWMVAATVRGCASGPFAVAVLDPPAARPGETIPSRVADAIAEATTRAALAQLEREDSVRSAPASEPSALAPASGANEVAWRVAGATYALAQAPAGGEECGQTPVLRMLLLRDTAGATRVALAPTQSTDMEGVEAIADLDGDGSVEMVVWEEATQNVRVLHLTGGEPTVVFEGGEIPIHGCPC